MSHVARRRLCWLIAVGMTAAMFAAAFLWLDVQYATNDDAGFVRAFLGFETGTPARFSIFIHGLLAQPLGALSEAVPGVAWFSWMQLALLALASVVSLKSAMQCALNTGAPFGWGVGLALVYLVCFVMPYCVRINFTQTAALLGAAAVWQLMSVDYARAGGRAVFGGVALAGLLLALAYALRQITALPLAAFFLLAWVYVLLMGGKRCARPMLAGLAAVAVLFAGLAGWREVEIANSGAQEYIAWQEANEPILDRYGFEAVPQEAIDALGWSNNTLSLVASGGFYLDGELNTEAFQYLTDSVLSTRDMSLKGQMNEAWLAMAKAWEETPEFRRSVAMLLICALLLVLPCLQKRRWIPALTASVALCGLAGVLLILAFTKGRMPMRAMMMGLHPCAAVVLALLSSAMGGGKRRKLCALLLVFLFGFTGTLTGIWLSQTISSQEAQRDWSWSGEGNAFADLLEYALDNEDMFIIHDMTMIDQFELFPNTEWGVPHNVSCWGGWSLRSPESVEQFANYDIDLWHFPPETFLREDVLLATSAIDPPPVRMLEYLREKVDPNVECTLYSEYGYAYLFQFYLP